MEGVLGYSNFHCWQLKSGTNVCSVDLQVHPQVNEQILRQRVHQLLRRYEIQQITVQVEKDNHHNQTQLGVRNSWEEQQQHQSTANRYRHDAPVKAKDTFLVEIGT
jgi:hypothetical protein